MSTPIEKEEKPQWQINQEKRDADMIQSVINSADEEEKRIQILRDDFYGTKENSNIESQLEINFNEFLNKLEKFIQGDKFLSSWQLSWNLDKINKLFDKYGIQCELIEKPNPKVKEFISEMKLNWSNPLKKVQELEATGKADYKVFSHSIDITTEEAFKPRNDSIEQLKQKLKHQLQEAQDSLVLSYAEGLSDLNLEAINAISSAINNIDRLNLKKNPKYHVDKEDKRGGLRKLET